MHLCLCVCVSMSLCLSLCLSVCPSLSPSVVPLSLSLSLISLLPPLSLSVSVCLSLCLSLFCPTPSRRNTPLSSYSGLFTPSSSSVVSLRTELTLSSLLSLGDPRRLRQGGGGPASLYVRVCGRVVGSQHRSTYVSECSCRDASFPGPASSSLILSPASFR